MDIVLGTFSYSLVRYISFDMYILLYSAGSQAMSYELYVYEVHTVQVQVQVHGAGVVT